MSDLQNEINHRVDAFVADITELAKQAAREILENSLGSTTRRASGKGAAPAPARSSSVRRKSGKRSPDEIQETANALLEYIRERPGQRMEAIAKAMNTSTKELTLPTKKLLQSKLIRVEGQKRATSYFPASGRATRVRKRRGRKKS